MATDVVAVIEARLREIETEIAPLEQEREQLARALRALHDDDRRRPSARSSPRRSTARRTKRAKHGSNVQAIVEFVRAHPGATTPQIAEGTGISRAVVYSALSRLTSAGRLAKQPRDDGSVAYAATAERVERIEREAGVREQV